MHDARSAAFGAVLSLLMFNGPTAIPNDRQATGGASPAEKSVRRELAAPPANVRLALRAAVSNECIAFPLPTGGTLKIWPARQVRAAAPRSPDEPALLRERVLSSIEAGSLVAVASWESPWRDYRDQQIPAGTYALIYVIQPAFKQHRSVSEFRDALLLLRPSDALANLDLAQLVAASRAVSGTSHPAVAALFPVDPSAVLPRVSTRSDGGLSLEFRAGAYRLGLAISGKGHLEGTES